MVRYRVLWEAHVRRFQDAHEQYKKGRLTAEEAGELLGLSGRHFRRQCVRYEPRVSRACGTSGSGVFRTAMRWRANWSGCDVSTKRNTRTSRSSTSTRSCAGVTTIRLATR